MYYVIPVVEGSGNLLMIKEIGSFMEQGISYLEHTDNDENIVLKEVDKYKKKYTYYTATGRDAIFLALDTISKTYLSERKCCLVPIYICDMVLIPFQVLQWDIVYYHIDKDMQPKIDEMKKLLQLYKPNVVFLNDYFGRRINSRVWKILEPYRDSTIIIEDVTQSYYIHESHIKGDYIIGSIRKWYPIPDGGFLTCNDKISVECINFNNEQYVQERLEIMNQKYAYLQGNIKEEKEKKESKKRFLNNYYQLEENLNEYARNAMISPISNMSKCIINQLDLEYYRQKRYENCSYLKEQLLLKNKDYKLIYSEENVPMGLYFPLLIKNRKEFQTALIEQNIFTSIVWPFTDEYSQYFTEEEKYLQEHVISIPVDARYDINDMERILKAIEEFSN
ncbi:MAG: hypothetical protein IKL49_02630 [Lachnospiraceae bacterium]|nr:hypothetical protein [Lachnospiraceae bacterium]